MLTRILSKSSVLTGMLVLSLLLLANGCVSDTANIGDVNALAPTQVPAGWPKNFILIIGDGMQLQHEIAGSRYLYGADRELSFHKLPYSTVCSTWDVSTYDRYAFAAGQGKYTSAVNWLLGYDPAQGGAQTYPETTGSDGYYLDKLVKFKGAPDTAKEPATDSGSAATAMSTGEKTDDGNLAWLPGDPDDGKLTTVFEQFRAQQGGAIGVVSTVPFSHATPAAFVSHNKTRNNYNEIAHEIITVVKPEVVIGGGHPDWDDAFMDSADVDLLRNSSDYEFVERQAGADGGELLSAAAANAVAQDKKLFGLFGGAGGSFEYPVPENAPGNPDFAINEENPQLPEAALAALEVLSQDKDGFALMIEQGDIDWANHANDYAWMVGTIWDLDQTVKAVLDFINQPGDLVTPLNTVVIVTSDHSNSYMRLISNLGKGGLPAQEKTPAALRQPRFATEEDQPRAASYVSPLTYPGGEVTYGTSNHTNELVMLYVWGTLGPALFTAREGAHYPGTRIVDNTDIFHVASAWLLQ